VSRQKYFPKRLIVVPHHFSDQNIDRLENLISEVAGEFTAWDVFRIPDSVIFGGRLNMAIEASRTEYWTKFDDDDIYYENYLPDAMSCIVTGGFDLVGKAEHFVYLQADNITLARRFGRRNRASEIICGATFLARKNNGLRFGELATGEDSELLAAAKMKKSKIFSMDPFNYVMVRSADHERHTWRVSGEYFKESSIALGSGLSEHLARA
jgi:hypothetical protein